MTSQSSDRGLRSRARLSASTSPMAAAATPEMARIPMAAHLFGLSRSRLYRLAGDGHIRFVKVGKATLVDMASVRRFLASVPAADIRPAA